MNFSVEQVRVVRTLNIINTLNILFSVTRTQGTCHIYLTLNMYTLNHSFLCENVVRRFSSHIFYTINKKWRHVKPKRKKKEWSNLIFFQNCPKNQRLHFLVHGHSSWSTFGLHLGRGPNLLKLMFYEVGPWKWDHWLRPSSMVHSVNRP